MKLALLAFILSGSAAFAFPAHEPDGYRDTGCDPSLQVDLGGYSNNPSCVSKDGGAAFSGIPTETETPKPDPKPVKDEKDC